MAKAHTRDEQPCLVISSGTWLNEDNHYLGLSFQVNGETHYGWAKLSVDAVNVPLFRVTVTGYAYETIAGQSLAAGEISGDTLEEADP
jgi:hypothetical protein